MISWPGCFWSWNDTLWDKHMMGSKQNKQTKKHWLQSQREGQGRARLPQSPQWRRVCPLTASQQLHGLGTNTFNTAAFGGITDPCCSRKLLIKISFFFLISRALLLLKFLNIYLSRLSSGQGFLLWGWTIFLKWWLIFCAHLGLRFWGGTACPILSLQEFGGRGIAGECE